MFRPGDVIKITAKGLKIPLLLTILLCLTSIPLVINTNIPVFGFIVLYIPLIFSVPLIVEKYKIAQNGLPKIFKVYFIAFSSTSLLCFLLFGLILNDASVLYALLTFVFIFVLPVSLLTATYASVRDDDKKNGSNPLKAYLLYTIGITFLSFTSLGIHTAIINQPPWLIFLQFMVLSSLNILTWIKTLNIAAQSNTLITLGVTPSLNIINKNEKSKNPDHSEHSQKEKNSKYRGAFIQFSEKISPLGTEINENANTLKNSYEEQSTVLKELANSMLEMRRNTRENKRNAQFAKKISQNAVLMVDEMTRNSIASLELIEQITQKINIVNDIARQTRFLSLNAAVEAARAGEHGKGFAVVAEEIKKLSENSRKAADEIIKLSKETVSSTEKTQKTAEDLAPEVQNSSALLLDTAIGTKELADNFKEMVTFIQSLEQETRNKKEEAETVLSNAELLGKLSHLFREEIINGHNKGRNTTSEPTHKTTGKTDLSENLEKNQFLSDEFGQFNS